MLIILREKYEEGKRLAFVKNPLAWALYQTWKAFDGRGSHEA